MEKDLKVKVADLNEAIFETQIELEELMMTLSELLVYDTNLELNSVDLSKYATGKEETKIGKLSYRFLCEHKRIMWLVRTAMVYCEQAQKICESTKI
jgi:hypothetical protein